MSAADAIAVSGLTKIYRMPVGSDEPVFEMPLRHWPLWARFLTWPVRLTAMLGRAPFRAAAGLLAPQRPVPALDHLNLIIRRGEVFGLLGPNGAGKTTTINLLLGLIWPTRGKAFILGYPPGDLRTKRRIGFLPEETYLYRHLNAEESLRFYGSLFGLDRDLLERRVRDLLDLVGFDLRARRRPLRTYSKGMARRIGLAQALINDPDVVILDEPTSGLDPVGSLQMKDLIIELKRQGKTILMSSHLLADVEDVCDRACILYRGKIAVEGRIDELLAVRDTYQLQARNISPDLAARIEQLVRSEGGVIESIGFQRTRLENLFRDLVARRRAEEVRPERAGFAGGPPAAEPPATVR